MDKTFYYLVSVPARFNDLDYCHPPTVYNSQRSSNHSEGCWPSETRRKSSGAPKKPNPKDLVVQALHQSSANSDASTTWRRSWRDFAWRLQSTVHGFYPARSTEAPGACYKWQRASYQSLPHRTARLSDITPLMPHNREWML